RAFLSGISVRRVGQQIARSGNRIGDDRSGRRSLSERQLGLGGSEGACGSLILVGSGKMGAALLRGWIANGAASRFLVVEPEGTPPAFTSDAPGEWHRAAGTLPGALVPAAVGFAVHP